MKELERILVPVDEELERILVPVDGSPASDEAVRFAAALAAGLGAAIDVLHVAYFDSDTDDAEATWLPESVAGPTGPAARALLDAARQAIGDGAKAAFHQRTGTPAEAILAFAEERRADLIVMGSRRMAPLRAALLGSVSTAVLRGASCPVTVVREKEDA